MPHRGAAMRVLFRIQLVFGAAQPTLGKVSWACACSASCVSLIATENRDSAERCRSTAGPRNLTAVAKTARDSVMSRQTTTPQCRCRRRCPPTGRPRKPWRSRDARKTARARRGRLRACRSSRCCVVSSAPLRMRLQTTSTKPMCRSDRKASHQRCLRRRSPQQRDRNRAARLIHQKRGLTARSARWVTTTNRWSQSGEGPRGSVELSAARH